jgi:hypothetical protein
MEKKWYNPFSWKTFNPDSDEKLKLRLSFLKFLIGTIALGITSTIINGRIQDREIDLKEQEAISKYIEPALQEDIGVRHRFAQYFSIVTNSTRLRERWKIYCDTVDKEYLAKVKEKDSLKAKLSSDSLNSSKRVSLLSRIQDLEASLSTKISDDYSELWNVVATTFDMSEKNKAEEFAQSLSNDLKKFGKNEPVKIVTINNDSTLRVIVGNPKSRLDAKDEADYVKSLFSSGAYVEKKIPFEKVSSKFQ